MHVDRQLLSEHATGVGDTLLPIDRKSDRDRVYEFTLTDRPRTIRWTVGGLTQGVGLLENSMQIRFIDLLTADIDINAQNFRLGGTGAEIYGHRADGFLGDLFGHVDRFADGIFGGVHIDNRTVANTAADLMTGANDARLSLTQVIFF